MAVVNGFSNEAAATFRDAHIAFGALVHTNGTPGTFHVFGESGRTEEVVDAVLFLASARAS